MKLQKQNEPMAIRNRNPLFIFGAFTVGIAVASHLTLVLLAVIEGGPSKNWYWISFSTYLSLMLGQLELILSLSVVLATTLILVRNRWAVMLLSVAFLSIYIPLATLLLYVRGNGGLGGLP